MNVTTPDVAGIFSGQGGANTVNSSSKMDKDAFLKLLVTQLSYQDPLNPMKNEDFSAQMAQFSSLEEMMKLNQNLTNVFAGQSIAQSSSLIGKSIRAKDASGETVEGVVSSVEIKNATPFLKVAGKLVALYDLLDISN